MNERKLPLDARLTSIHGLGWCVQRIPKRRRSVGWNLEAEAMRRDWSGVRRHEVEQRDAPLGLG